MNTYFVNIVPVSSKNANIKKKRQKTGEEIIIVKIFKAKNNQI